MMNEKTSSLSNLVVYFDDDCLLCNGFIQWLIRRDKKEVLHFSTLQSESGRSAAAEVLPDASDLSTLIFREDGKVFTQSTAVLRILRRLGNGWQFFCIFRYVPQTLRDGIYRFIAARRYLFGKKTECLLPDEGLRKRIKTTY